MIQKETKDSDKERDRERQTDRQTETGRDRDRDRDRDRQRQAPGEHEEVPSERSGPPRSSLDLSSRSKLQADYELAKTWAADVARFTSPVD